MKKLSKFHLVVFLAVSACVEPFNASVDKSNIGFLVVDGFINTTTQSAVVKLSRAIALGESESPPKVDNAIVELEAENGERFNFTPKGNGQYEYTSTQIVNNRGYRLYIKTSDQREYRSDFIVPKESPPIDSVTWNAEEDGIHINVSSHDERQESTYYRWDYSETWEYQTPLYSGFILVDGIPKSRPTDQSVFLCYRTEHSNIISVTTTEGLSEDRVSNFELAFVPILSQKYKKHYSILVRQFVLSKESYDYWKQLQVSTENLGSLFDPQPARVKGNIYNVNTDEPVIGYFDGGSVSEKRIFIRLGDLPDYLKKFPRSECEEAPISVAMVGKLSNDYVITSALTFGNTIIGYNFTSIGCADCRSQGGTTTKPDFWP